MVTRTNRVVSVIAVDNYCIVKYAALAADFHLAWQAWWERTVALALL